MKANELAQQTMFRLGLASLEDRLSVFLSKPENLITKRGQRVLELLDIARQRRDTKH